MTEIFLSTSTTEVQSCLSESHLVSVLKEGKQTWIRADCLDLRQ